MNVMSLSVSDTHRTTHILSISYGKWVHLAMLRGNTIKILKKIFQAPTQFTLLFVVGILYC
jgi:hypothetical protein